MSERYVYRTSDDIEPRATANAGHSTVNLGALPYAGNPIFAPLVNKLIAQQPAACPAWGCGPAPITPVRVYPLAPIAPIRITPYPDAIGATSSVPQPPPLPQSPGSAVVSNPSPLPLAPAPSPTVAVAPAQTAPSLTQPGTALDSSGASVTVAPSGITAWLSEQTLFNGFANWEVAGAGLLAAWFLFRGKGKR